MREALFTVSTRPDGTSMAECSALRVVISAMVRDELQEEARDALIRAAGPAHVSYRVRLQQTTRTTASTVQKIQPFKHLQRR